MWTRFSGSANQVGDHGDHQDAYQSYQIVDVSERIQTGDVMLPFAYDEWQCTRVGQGGAMPTIHLWRHRSAMVLGLRDRKLPKAKQVMECLAADGDSVIVRHSGGAAVPLDDGVLNVSLIYPRSVGRIELDDDFRLMVDLVAGALGAQSDHVQVGEVEGSYCPGRFDLSVGGRKFCGISQRRQTQATIVQAFINITGSGKERSARAIDYYRHAAGQGQADYPHVDLDRTTSLAEEAETTAITSMQQYVEGLKRYLIQTMERPPILVGDYTAPRGELEAMSQNLRDRYDR